MARQSAISREKQANNYLLATVPVARVQRVSKAREQYHSARKRLVVGRGTEHFSFKLVKSWTIRCDKQQLKILGRRFSHFDPPFVSSLP